MCRACEQDLILRAVKPTAKQQPHFRHRNSQEYPASAERRRQVDLDDQVVIDLRDTLLRAWPGVSICLELPQDPQETEPGQGPPAGLPPALVVCGPQETVVIERPRSLPGPDQVGGRLRAVRSPGLCLELLRQNRCCPDIPRSPQGCNGGPGLGGDDPGHGGRLETPHRSLGQSRPGRHHA